MKFTVSLAESHRLKDRADAALLLTKPKSGHLNFDVEVITFKSRLALEEFNKRARLSAVVLTQVPMNCALHPHQSDSVAREAWHAARAQ